jgi:uncharacterized protein YdcH (DUF465 family)
MNMQASSIEGDEASRIEQLRREHHELDLKVGEIEQRAYLTAEEDAEVKRLKRLKLATKDMIFLLSRRLGQPS